MLEDLNNPYRRALLVAGLEEIKQDDVQIYEHLTKFLTDLIVSVADNVGTNLLNINLKKNDRIKSLFPNFQRQLGKEQKESQPVSFVLPNGTIVDIEG